MIAAAAVLVGDLRRAAELAHHEHDRLGQQSPFVEIADQGRQSLIKLVHQVAVVQPKVLEVRVPDLIAGKRVFAADRRRRWP